MRNAETLLCSQGGSIFARYSPTTSAAANHDVRSHAATPSPGTWISVNPSAAGLFGQPGGLPEVQFLYGTERGTVTFPILVPW